MLGGFGAPAQVMTPPWFGLFCTGGLRAMGLVGILGIAGALLPNPQSVPLRTLVAPCALNVAGRSEGGGEAYSMHPVVPSGG